MRIACVVVGIYVVAIALTFALHTQMPAILGLAHPRPGTVLVLQLIITIFALGILAGLLLALRLRR